MPDTFEDMASLPDQSQAPIHRPSSVISRLHSAVHRPSSIVANQESLISTLLLLFAVIFNLTALYPEVAIKAPMFNDGVLHYLALERMVSAWESGQIAVDLWLPSIALGYPLFHNYQHLPYIVQTAVFQLLPESISLLDLFNWSNYLLLSLFPLSIYWSMRHFGFARLTAAMSGLVASLLATNGLYGFDFSSYLWSGYGLYSQLWGMFFLPPALAAGTVYLRTGRGIVLSTLLLAATALSHLLLGYMALLSLVALFFIPLLGPSTGVKRQTVLWQRGKRLLFLFLLAAVLTAYFWVPFLIDSPYMNRSIWEESGKVNAYGIGWTLSTLVRGELFDYGRFPSFTLLAAAGLGICLWRWREERYRVPVILSLLWLLLYFGRPTWGMLLDLLPLSGTLHLHRFIAGIHLGGIFLMGIALALPWQWALARGKFRELTAVTILTLLLLLPVYNERGLYLANNKRLMAESKAAYDLEKEDLDTVLATLESLPPGRVYAGNEANWGKEYRIGAVPLYALLQTANQDMVGYLYHALSLNADIQMLFDESKFDQYELFNVRYVIAPNGHELPDFAHLVITAGRHNLYQVRTSGYFELVTTTEPQPIDQDTFYAAAANWLQSDQPQEKEHPILHMQGPLAIVGLQLAKSEDCRPDPLAQSPTHPIYSHLISEEIEPGAYTAVVHVDHPSCLLLKATYHPNWHATIDGHETEIAMVMPSYVGLKVLPGTHLVHVEYAPRLIPRFLQFIIPE